MAWTKKTAAALTAVSMVRLLTWQSAPPPTHTYTHISNLFPRLLGSDMLKYRKGGREDPYGPSRRGIGHVRAEWLVA